MGTSTLGQQNYLLIHQKIYFSHCSPFRTVLSSLFWPKCFLVLTWLPLLTAAGIGMDFNYFIFRSGQALSCEPETTLCTFYIDLHYSNLPIPIASTILSPSHLATGTVTAFPVARSRAELGIPSVHPAGNP